MLKLKNKLKKVLVKVEKKSFKKLKSKLISKLALTMFNEKAKYFLSFRLEKVLYHLGFPTSLQLNATWR